MRRFAFDTGARYHAPMADQTDPSMQDEIAALRAEVARLNTHKFVTMHNSPIKLLLFQFMRGIAMGFGTVVGATILVSFAAYLLAQIDFVPIIGDWATRIAEEIRATLPSDQQ